MTSLSKIIEFMNTTKTGDLSRYISNKNYSCYRSNLFYDDYITYHHVYFNILDEENEETNNRITDYQDGNEYLRFFEIIDPPYIPINKKEIRSKVLNLEVNIIHEEIIKSVRRRDSVVKNAGFLMKFLVEIPEYEFYGVMTIQIIKSKITKYNIITHVYADYETAYYIFTMQYMYKDDILKPDTRSFDFQFAKTLYYCENRKCQMPIYLETVLLSKKKQLKEIPHDLFEKLKEDFEISNNYKPLKNMGSYSFHEKLKNLEKEKLYVQEDTKTRKDYLMSLHDSYSKTSYIIHKLLEREFSLYQILGERYKVSYSGSIYYHFLFNDNKLNDNPNMNEHLKKFEVKREVTVYYIKSDLSKRVLETLKNYKISETVDIIELDVDKLFDNRLDIFVSKSKFEFIIKTSYLYGICVLKINQSEDRRTNYSIICHLYLDCKERNDKFIDISDYDYIKQFE